MFNLWIYLSKDSMLQSLIIISAFIFGFQTSEASDKKYFLSTTESPEYVTSLEDAQTKCKDSWLLEIYDENVVTTLKNLNLNIQQNGIVLGMKRGSNSWRWSDGTTFSGNIIDQTETTRVVACITNTNNKVELVAKTILGSAGVICSKVSTKDDCAGWFHNGWCYFKLTTTFYNWFEAHNVCIKNNASMAMFNNSETNFNTSFIDNQIYWVSLSRSTWMWTHENKAVTFNKWTSGQPEKNDKNCATTNSDGSEWTPVYCSGTYHIVCMREINPENPGFTQQANNSTTTSVTPNIYHEPTTPSLLSKPGGNSNFSEPTNAEPLSIGAKAGIGVGVSLLLIIIVIVGVLFFKYFHHCKKTFEQKSSTKTLESENHYAEIVPGNKYTESTDNNHSAISYADLDLQSRNTLANYD